jgi:uncharacterized protein
LKSTNLAQLVLNHTGVKIEIMASEIQEYKDCDHNDMLVRAKNTIVPVIGQLVLFLGSHGLLYNTDHGFPHMMAVLNNSEAALLYTDDHLSFDQLVAIMLAALLHDVDDRKLFKSVNYANARTLMEGCRFSQEQQELVVEMISYVSSSKNGNSCPVPDSERWKLIPRDADRIEAVGKVGIIRCYDTTMKLNNPNIVDSTPLPMSLEELQLQIKPERYQDYMASGNSASMLDHFYDKLLHLDDLQCRNKYLVSVMKSRKSEIESWLLETTAEIVALRYIVESVRDCCIAELVAQRVALLRD